ncbi:DUF397 domain-containing protein [Streptomyces olivoreticuli]|uniref:DUF397 domain-containing protein n=1 Tax=Streptomyces olivoreticuli TaxID=68246 RepID=UPI0026582B7C|nr:DUF397 domain-containing protein [Streptomyces olivoreticuli]WKK26583.1 DUF397 domain-containing protein [Streptomyces olivoreticuli]
MAAEIRWQKSSYSGGDHNQECVELAAIDKTILIRESDNPEQIIKTSRAKLYAFMLGVKAGEFDHLI